MGTLSLTRVTSGNTISSATENNNQIAIESVINGGIENSNIKSSAGIEASKLESAVNPDVYLATLFNNVGFVMSGMSVSDGGGLVATVATGYCYVPDSNELKRVYHSSSSNVTCTDDSTNYVYINSAGTLSVSASATESDKTLLAKVVCASGSITSITDCARRQPVHGQEHQIDGLELEYSDSTHVKVNAGVCWIAGVKYLLINQEDVDLDTASNWIDGSVYLPNSSHWVYVYVSSTGTLLSVKLSETAPAYSDAYGNSWSSSIDRYHYASLTPYRCIGAIYVTDNGSAHTAVRKFYQTKDYVQYDELQAVSSGAETDADKTLDQANIPAVSVSGVFELWSDSSNEAKIKPKGATDYLSSGIANGNNANTYPVCLIGDSSSFTITTESATATVKTAGYYLNIR